MSRQRQTIGVLLLSAVLGGVALIVMPLKFAAMSALLIFVGVLVASEVDW